MHWSCKNVGKIHANVDQSGDLMLGDERFARSSEDESRSWTIMQTHLDYIYTNQVNPGESAKSLDVYQVSAGRKPDSIWFPMETVQPGSSYIQVSTH
jgi:hypothetical protein